MTMWLAKDGTVRHAAVIARLRRDVIAKQPVDDRERQSLSAFVEAFDQLEEPFAQESNLIHVTGSALVVGPRGVVLLKHKRLGFWLQPGGHIDPGESPWAAALREAREETGLEVHFVGPLDDEGFQSCCTLMCTLVAEGIRISTCGTCSMEATPTLIHRRARARRLAGTTGRLLSSKPTPAWKASCAFSNDVDPICKNRTFVRYWCGWGSITRPGPGANSKPHCLISRRARLRRPSRIVMAGPPAAHRGMRVEMGRHGAVGVSPSKRQQT